jgi:hypothetical protein
MAVAALQAIGTKVITATLGFSYLTPTAALLAGTATVALGAAALRALTPKPSLPKVTGYNVTSRGSALDHQVVYGKTRVAGVEVFKATTGTDNAYLHLVLAFTGHEIESFEEIWINDEKATLDGNGNVTTVTTEDGDTSSRYSNKLTIIKRLGGTDNATPPDFGSSPNRPTDAGWTSVHKLTGISYLYCRLKFDRDAFPNGIPEIQATVKGKKVYNPDTATTEWSDNPALCIRDYLISSGYGLGEATSAIDDTLFVAAAEACDVTSDHSQTPTIWGSSYPIGTKKYTLNGAFTTGAKPADVLEDMLTSMGGTLWYAQGKWRVKAAKWYAPTVALDEDDLRSGMTINTRHAARDNFNTIKGTFKGVESNYIETDYQQFPKDDSTNPFITVDNGQKSVIDIPLAFTDNSVTARRLARIALERHRQQLTFTATFGMKAFQLQVGDVVNITNTRMGWSSKAFEIVSWTFTTGQDLELLVEMSLRETAEAAFDEEDDGVIYERDNTTLFSPFFVPSVSLDSPFSSNAMNSDGTAVPFIDFSWTATDPSRIDYYVFEWSTDAGVTYNPTTTSGTTFRLSPTETGKTYLYRVTPYNYLGVKGTTVTSAVGIAATADGTTPNAPTSLSASGGYRTATVTWTEPTTNTDASALTDLKYYRVYRGTSSNPTTEAGVTFSNIFTDGGLADATEYYYRVKAVDRTGNESAYSTDTNVTTNAELVDGAEGASVLVVYADDASGTNQSLSSSGKQFVQYVEYTGTAPSLPVSGTFVKFVGDDGATGQGIYSIYADDASGTNQSFSPSGKTFVTFFEATSAPTLPVTGQTFVKYVGDDGDDGDQGDDGPRGAGRWYVGVTSLPIDTDDADTEFSSLGFDPVDRDQAWFYTGTIGSPTAQSVWIYNETTDTWNEQEEVIDGDLIVTGTITSNQIEAGSILTTTIASGAVAADNIAPDAVNSSLININSPLNFGQPTSAILGGRESLSDFSTAGFYIGRTSSDGTNADGFQLSHTSTNNNGDVQGVVHDSTGFNIFEPTFRLKSGTSTPNTALTTQGQTISLAYGQVHTISIIGGGGGGGGASNETSTKAGTYHGTAGSSGGNTTITLTGASGYSGTTSWTASGGSGGARGEDDTNHWNRGGGYTPDGPSGQTAGYGDGGAGGDGVLITLGTDRNGNNGSSPSSTSYGAGGGAGSPASNTNVNEIWWGNAGGSGGAGQVLTVEIDLTSATTDGTLTLTTLGSGGSGGAGFGPLDGTTSGSGGSGADGALVVVSELDGYTALSVNDVRFTFFEPDHSIAITSFTDNGTDHTVYGPFTEDRFVEMSGSYLGAYSWNTNDRWGLKVYATTSAVASRAYIISISGSSSASSSTTDSTVTGSTNLSTGNAGTNGIFFGYATRDRAYSTLSFSVKLFLPAGATIRQVGEWNGVAPTSVGISGGAWIV